ncbi:uncharacterized protein fam217bb isoform 2-T2 [Menidia menidia]
MGRRQSQRMSPQPQQPFESQEHTEKRPQRRKHRSNVPLTKCKSPQHSAQETSVSNPDPPAGGRMEPKGQLAARRKHRDRKPTTTRRSKHKTASSSPPLLDSSSVLRETQEEEEVQSSHGRADDSDTDLSESERLPVSSSSSSFRRVPPQLELRPEAIKEEDCFPQSSRIRGQSHAESQFPDFLPPPFNSWSLGQLAVFYNMEGRAAPRARPVGPLERYLEKLLQLEWRQIQTVQEESGRSEITSSCQRSAAAASARLSTPKCILQCQRAFPLTLLSSLASRHSTCSAASCHSHHASTHQSRLSPMLERGRGPAPLPKRSYSESRVPSSDHNSQFSSSAGTNSYLRRMQASGNIRKPLHGATARPHTIGWDSMDYARTEQVVSSRLVASRRRSGSEQRRVGAERQQNGSEKRRSDSECRKGRAQQRRVTTFQEQRAKQDAATTVLDDLSGSKSSSVQRPSRAKQVEFVT